MKWRARRDSDPLFLDTWKLYESCRRKRLPAKLTLETTEDGEENFTFSWKRASQPKVGAAPVAQKPANQPPPPPSEPSRRKSPSKLRKDWVKWVSWLERKLEETRREELPSRSRLEATPAASVPRSAPVCVEPAGSPQLETSRTLQGSGYTCFGNETEQRAGEDEDVYAAALQTIRDVPVPEPANPTVSSPGGTTLTMLQPMETSTEEDVPPSTPHRENTTTKQEPEFNLEDYELFDFSDKNPSDIFVLKLAGYYKHYKFKLAELDNLKSCTNSYGRETCVPLAHNCNDCENSQFIVKKIGHMQFYIRDHDLSYRVDPH